MNKTEIDALVALLRDREELVINRDGQAVYQPVALCVEAATALTALQAERDAAVARAEVAEGALSESRVKAGDFLPLCECGMSGPCMWDKCKSPLLTPPADLTQEKPHE
jgi:hypothetical protein